MAKPKAPAWLCESFRDGVDEAFTAEHGLGLPRPAYPGASPWCWLAQFDPARRPCTEHLERFHFIPRQRVEHALWALLPAEGAWFALEDADAGEDCATWQFLGRWDVILLAAWDSRNGGFGCEGHHRRLDKHQVSLPREQILIPYSALPGRVSQFALTFGLEHEMDRFPSSV